MTAHVSRTNGLVTPEDKENRFQQKGVTIWLTGLSASGKSTIAKTLERKLFDQGYLTLVLDGDNIRQGLNNDLGFSPEDRSENIRRVAELASLISRSGIINIAAFISPYLRDRSLARKMANNANFVEVYLRCPLEVCKERDPKGLYKKAAKGEIKDFTGIDAPYEVPEHPDVIIDTDRQSVEKCVSKIFKHLREKHFII